MMKNIPLLAGGGDSDEAVFATALALSLPFCYPDKRLRIQKIYFPTTSQP
jgi:hypothetical protein